LVPHWRPTVARLKRGPPERPIMAKVTVYEYLVVDPYRIERRKSRRWGTREGIESLKDFAEILEGTAIEVDASAVDSSGFTQLDFNPTAG
jgi:hypothetical protein